jgi:hypothetical protein
MKKSESFSIRRDEILGIGKKKYSLGTMRGLDILLLNTKDRTFSLFAVEQMDQLKDELQQKMKDA